MSARLLSAVFFKEGFGGTVMAIERNINMLKQFGIRSNSPMARQLLGRLGRKRWHRLRVRGQSVTAEQPIIPEVSAFISATQTKACGIREGHGVLISTEPYAPPGKDPVWVVTEVTPISG